MVKTLPFGDTHINSPGFGAMGISFGYGSNLSLEEAEPVLLKAVELGCTFWDTAVRLAWKSHALQLKFFAGRLCSRSQRTASR